MTRKKSQLRSSYRLLDSAPLEALPEEIQETGTVRIADLLDVLLPALAPFPEAKQSVLSAIYARLGAGDGTRIEP